MKRQRRRYRDAEGIEEVGIAEGVGVLPQPTRGLGERRELPQPSPRRRPGRKRRFSTF